MKTPKIILAIFAFLYLLSSLCFAQINFSPPVIIDSAGSFFVADVDGDQDLDIISGYSTPYPRDPAKLFWHENDGNQNFTRHTISDSMDRVTSVFVTDMDRDDNMDVLCVYWGSSQNIVWFKNDGSENFTEHNIYSAPLWGDLMLIAIDLENDNDTDVIFSADDQIAWMENDGNENFTFHLISGSVGINRLVSVSDIDGDNDLDVLSSSEEQAGLGKINWYENDGNQNFTSNTIIEDSSFLVASIPKDIDEDRDLDLIYSAAHNFPNSYRIGWLENDGNENFTSHTIDDTSYFFGTIMIHDIDGDGDADVIAGSSGFGGPSSEYKIVWFENDGSESFIEHLINSGYGASSIYVLDIDGDGDQEIISSTIVGGPWNFLDLIIWYENLTVTGIESDSKTIPNQFALNQNYPNPFNPTTTIEFSFPQSGFVALKIYNIFGEEVATLVSEKLNAGKYRYDWDAGTLASGIYLYRIQAENYVEVRKMVLMR
jgi:hypothetical protein